MQECVESKYCCMPKDKVDWNSHPMEHGLKGWDVACHGKRKMALTTCPFWTHRNLYSKEGSTPPDLKVNMCYMHTHNFMGLNFKGTFCRSAATRKNFSPQNTAQDISTVQWTVKKPNLQKTKVHQIDPYAWRAYTS